MQRSFKWEPCTFLEKKESPLSPNWFAHKLTINHWWPVKFWTISSVAENVKKNQFKPLQRSLNPHWETKVPSSRWRTKVLKRETAGTPTLVITNLVKLIHKDDSILKSQGTYWTGVFLGATHKGIIRRWGQPFSPQGARQRFGYWDQSCFF